MCAWLSHRFNFSNVTIAEYTLIITYIHIQLWLLMYTYIRYSCIFNQVAMYIVIIKKVNIFILTLYYLLYVATYSYVSSI